MLNEKLAPQLERVVQAAVTKELPKHIKGSLVPLGHYCLEEREGVREGGGAGAHAWMYHPCMDVWCLLQLQQ